MDLLVLGLRVVLSLAAVLLLVWLLQRRFRSGGAGAGANPVSILGRRGIGTKASVVVVETEGKRFVLGVTESQVTVLHTADAAVDATRSDSFRRQLREAEAARPEFLSGSLLSVQTWKQAAAAIRNGPGK